MKKVILGVALTLIAGSAMAGALVDPIVAPVEIIEQTSASSMDQGILVPFLFLAFMAVVFFG